jgi:hypothetical protein
MPRHLLPEITLDEVAEMFELGVIKDAKGLAALGFSLSDVKTAIMEKNLLRDQKARWQLDKEQMRKDLSTLERLSKTRPQRHVVLNREYYETDDFKATRDEIEAIFGKFERQLKGYYNLYKNNRDFESWYEAKIKERASEIEHDGSFPEYFRTKKSRDEYPVEDAWLDYGDEKFAHDHKWRYYKEKYREANKLKTKWESKYRTK